MYNETKSILKLAKNTTDEKLKEFLNEHYLKDEEEKTEEKVDAKKEVKEETKEEEKIEETKDETKEKEEISEFKKLFESMTKKIETLEKEVQKVKPFGETVRPPQGDGANKDGFDELFKKLSN